ncbi:hypothetical protein VTK26DRAFT_1976 [Humicola hyalothermophila]
MTLASTFSITAAPGTDIWRKPPTTDVFNAPTATPNTPLRTAGPLTSFLSARLSLSFAWQAQYDQGGLLLSFSRRSRSRDQGQDQNDGGARPPEKWIKTGIEFYNGQPRLSTVACDSWADWSVCDLSRPGGDNKDDNNERSSSGGEEKQWTTVQVEKDKDEHGTSLWVYWVLGDGSKVPLREICWVFGGQPEDWEVEVSAMAARPAKDGVEGGLVVEFGGMEVKWKED